MSRTESDCGGSDAQSGRVKIVETSVIENPQVAVERTWYCVQDGKSEGPLPESEILQMFREGRLGAESLLWTESMTTWVPAGRIETFHNCLASLPLVVVPAPRTLRQRAEEARAQGVPQVRPWVRYLARIYDIWVCAFLIGLVAGTAGVLVDIPEFALGLAIPFVWVFMESLLLSTWGTTPGKWLFKTWVADAMGNRLSFMDALSRSFSVWFMGLGFGLPIVSLITLIASYMKLKDQGLTSWDRDGRFAVIHERIGAPRVVVAILLVVAFSFIAALGRMAQIHAS